MLNKMDLMIDFETWGTAPNAVVRAAAVASFFPATGRIDGSILVDARGSIDHQLEYGRSTTPDTIEWWQRQESGLSEILRDMTESMVIVDDYVELVEILANYIRQADFERIWSRGAFDLRILSSMLGESVHWKFWQEYDVRTLDFLTPIPAPDIPHHPMSDVKAQIRQVHAAYMLRTESTQ